MLRLLLASATVLAGVTVANAAQISIVSMQYSAAQPVPHIHYEGQTVAGDVAQLQQVYDSFVKCRLECIGGDGGCCHTGRCSCFYRVQPLRDGAEKPLIVCD